MEAKSCRALWLVFGAGLLSACAEVEIAEVTAPLAFEVPDYAYEIAPDVWDLGETEDVDGTPVEGIAFVHRPFDPYRHHRPGHDAGPPGGGNGGTTCFAALGNGAIWRTVEPWVMNTSNNAGLDGATAFQIEAESIAGDGVQPKWEDPDGDGVQDFEIIGDGSTTNEVLVADEDSPDNVNEVLFGPLGPGTIGVTIVWGIFRGPPSGRELVEWDQVYDDVEFAWSFDGSAGTMDFENIATHENGHTIGLGHPPDECTEETMYRFAALGETKKRDLDAGDVAGVNDLYQ